MSCSSPASISSSSLRRPRAWPSWLAASALRMLRFQARWRRSWSAPPLPVRPWVTVKPRARLIVALSPSMVSAWPRFSIRRRLAYSGELAIRSMRALSAMSMAMMSAAVAMSASGSWASSMMRRAIPGGEGRLRQSASAAVSSGGMSGRSIPLGQEYLGMHHSLRISFLLCDCRFPVPSIGLIRLQRKGVGVRTNGAHPQIRPPTGEGHPQAHRHKKRAAVSRGSFWFHYSREAGIRPASPWQLRRRSLPPPSRCLRQRPAAGSQPRRRRRP